MYYIRKNTLGENVMHAETHGKRVIQNIFILFLVLFLGMGMPTSAAAQETVEGTQQENKDTLEHKTVRVGYDGEPTSAVRSSDGRRSGYAYEDYQKVSDYTGWKYEYVDIDLATCLEMLKTGEIDMIADCNYTPERAEYAYYSTVSTGKTYDYLITLYDNEQLQEVEDIKGQKIGVMNQSYEHGFLQQYVEENELDCEIVTYDRIDDAYDALERGEISAVYGNAYSVEAAEGLRLKAVGEYLSTQPYYFLVSKKRPDLYEELETALNAIVEMNPDYFLETSSAELEMKFFYRGSDLSDLAVEWLNEHDTIRMGYMQQYIPYTGTDEKTGDAKGVFIDVLREACDHYGLQLRTTAYDSVDEMCVALQDGQIDVIAPILEDEWFGEQEGIALSDDVVQGNVKVLYTATSDMEDPVIGVVSGDYLTEKTILAENPEARLKTYENQLQCISAVRVGDADITYIPSAFYTYDLNKDNSKYEGLQVSNYDGYNFTCVFGVEKGNAGLLDLLNREIELLSENFVQNSLLENSQYETKITLLYLLKNNFNMVAMMVIIIILVLLLAVVIQVSSVNANEKALAIAHEDSLTGIYNRAYGEECINKMIGSPDFKQGIFAIVDLDDLKIVNERLGHPKGDEILRSTADQLIAEFAQNGIVCRIGGDEFIAFFPVDDLNEAKKRLEKLRENLRRSLKGDQFYITVTTSIGAAIVPMYGNTFAQLYPKVDHAVVVSKDQGKDRITYYTEELEKQDPAEILMAKFENALEQHHFQVYYQPVIRTLSGDICGFEALSRWVDPEQGMIYPGDFIPVLEEKKQIHRLDLYMVREICSRMRSVMDGGEKPVPVSFNLSRYDFIACDVFEQVEALAQEFRVPRDRLVVEITESLMMENPQLVQDEIAKFHYAGYQVWMDDFGSGYSSLNVLKNFKFDEIKLDMVFMKDFDDRSKSVVTSVISMAKKLGTHILAEGVETKEQYEFLRNSGCEKVQGYYLGKPLPLDESIIHCREQGRGVETREWQECFEKIGLIEFLTDRPFAVLDFDGNNFKFLFNNDAYMEVLSATGATGMDMVHASMNSEKSPLREKFLALQAKGVIGGDSEEMVYEVRGSTLRIRGRAICRNGDHVLSVIEIVAL